MAARRNNHFRYRYWTAAETHESQERRAVHHLERQEWEHYLPETLVTRKSGKERSEVLFPGYVFIRIDLRRNWAPLHSTRGIARLIMCGSQPARMPDREIQVLKLMEVDGVVRLAPRFDVGQRIEVSHEGSKLVGLEGVYQGQTRAGRCEVLLSILGRSVPHEMLEGELSPL